MSELAPMPRQEHNEDDEKKEEEKEKKKRERKEQMDGDGGNNGAARDDEKEETKDPIRPRSTAPAYVPMEDVEPSDDESNTNRSTAAAAARSSGPSEDTTDSADPLTRRSRTESADSMTDDDKPSASKKSRSSGDGDVESSPSDDGTMTGPAPSNFEAPSGDHSATIGGSVPVGGPVSLLHATRGHVTPFFANKPMGDAGIAPDLERMEVGGRKRKRGKEAGGDVTPSINNLAETGYPSQFGGAYYPRGPSEEVMIPNTIDEDSEMERKAAESDEMRQKEKEKDKRFRSDSESSRDGDEFSPKGNKMN